MTTTPTPDPLAALAAELGRIGQRLDGMGVELLALREGGPAATASADGTTSGSAGVGQAGMAATAPGAPKRSPLTGARLLAWTGGAVSLLGVVLLLALAASRGWFTPPARVAFGAVLGAGLVGLGA